MNASNDGKLDNPCDNTLTGPCVADTQRPEKDTTR